MSDKYVPPTTEIVILKENGEYSFSETTEGDCIETTKVPTSEQKHLEIKDEY